MNYSKEPIFNSLPLKGSPIYDVTVRIIALEKDCKTVVASGTGVVIAQNLILSAKHVFDDFCEKWNLETSTLATIDRFNIWVVFISNEDSQMYHVFEVASVYISPHSDLVLFHLDPRDRIGNERKWVQAHINLELPYVGERVVGVGFIKSKVNVRIDARGQSHIEIIDEPVVSVGGITQVFPEKRDSYLRHYPCIEMNARFEGGMSGGPVFNDSGQLIGIVCSSFDLSDSNENISYASLLWPLMAIVVENIKDVSQPLYDLAKSGIIETIGLKRIRLSITGQKDIFNISYIRDNN